MSKIVYVSPNQTIDLVFEVLNSSQEREDAPVLPIVRRVYNPDMTLMAGFPQAMDNIDIGLYLFTFELPMGALAIGTYIIDVIWTNPQNKQEQTYYQLICRPKPNAAGEYVATGAHL